MVVVLVVLVAIHILDIDHSILEDSLVAVLVCSSLDTDLSNLFKVKYGSRRKHIRSHSNEEMIVFSLNIIKAIVFTLWALWWSRWRRWWRWMAVWIFTDLTCCTSWWWKWNIWFWIMISVRVIEQMRHVCTCDGKHSE